MVGYTSNQMKNSEWLEVLLKSKFFVPCSEHEEQKKNEMNVFCIDCKQCICQHCIASSLHFRHKQLQIRRYVYHDVVRLHDMHKLIDCSRVQPYTINGAKVIFLNPRPQPRPPTKSNSSGPLCRICERPLQEPNQHCSIACKISADDSFNLRDSLRLPDLCAATPAKENQNSESISNGDDSPQPDSPVSGDSSESNSVDDNWLCPALKPRRPLHKRKGIPRRSPIC